MTHETKSGISRRAFLTTTGVVGGGLLVAFQFPAVREMVSGLGTPSGPAFEPNAWLAVRPDGTVRILVDEMEMGQGVITAMPMIVAEELDVDWESVEVEYGPKDPSTWPRGISTGGSTSTRTGWVPLRRAGAQAREMLKSAAAQEWGVDVSELTTGSGRVRHDASGREREYGDLVEAASALPVPEEPPFKDPSEYRILGQRIPRVDTPEKVDGSKVFGIDVQVDGLATAVVERSPVFGGTLTDYDASGAEASPGVRSVVRISSGVAVVANDTWSAMQARDALTTEWDEGEWSVLTTEGLDERLRSVSRGPTAEARHDGNADTALAGTVRRIEADYHVPYLAHATMEPMNCTAWVKDDGSVEVWAPTQAASASQQVAAQVAGVEPAQVTIHSIPMGGGFGRRSNTDFVREAVEISRELGGPVKVVWSREDDTRGGYYRPIAFHRFAAGLGADGMPVAWDHTVTAPSIFYQLRPAALERSGGVDGDALAGAQALPYAIPNLRVSYARLPVDVPLWWWRAVGHSHNGFTTECFLDELAYAAEVDPAEYRRRLLADHPRHAGVLERVVQESGWGGSLPEGRARGLSVHESFGSFVAQVAEVSMESGRPRVHRITVAVDCGQTINPDTIEAQMDSSVAYGLTAALHGDINFEEGRVVEGNFDRYPILRMSEMPRVDTHIVESRESPGGIGEAGLPPVASAVCNGIFALTGRRVRRLPIADQLSTV